MRILHTSDWHLGQHFMGKTRQAEHQAFCQWLLEQVRVHEVDAVLVAGDVFDTGAPPSYAREQYYRFIVDLRASGARLVVLGGNHDSVAMLGESRELLAQLDTWVVPAVVADPDEQVRVLPRRDGQPGAVLCAVPFVRPRDVLLSQAGQSAEDKQLGLQQAIQAHYQALFERALQCRAASGGDLPIIATGHLTTVGASASESVRKSTSARWRPSPPAPSRRPTTSPWGTSTGRRRSAAWGTSATAARPSPWPSTRRASRRRCCWWSWTAAACARCRRSRCRASSRC